MKRHRQIDNSSSYEHGCVFHCRLNLIDPPRYGRPKYDLGRVIGYRKILLFATHHGGTFLALFILYLIARAMYPAFIAACLRYDLYEIITVVPSSGKALHFMIWFIMISLLYFYLYVLRLEGNFYWLVPLQHMDNDIKRACFCIPLHRHPILWFKAMLLKKRTEKILKIRLRYDTMPEAEATKALLQRMEISLFVEELRRIAKGHGYPSYSLIFRILKGELAMGVLMIFFIVLKPHFGYPSSVYVMLIIYYMCWAIFRFRRKFQVFNYLIDLFPKMILSPMCTTIGVSGFQDRDSGKLFEKIRRELPLNILDEAINFENMLRNISFKIVPWLFNSILAMLVIIYLTLLQTLKG